MVSLVLDLGETNMTYAERSFRAKLFQALKKQRSNNSYLACERPKSDEELEKIVDNFCQDKDEDLFESVRKSKKQLAEIAMQLLSPSLSG